MSREEELLTALINGEDVSGWKCRSRMEEYLVKCCCGDTCDGMTPKTRVEVLLKQLATKIAEGGSGGGEDMLQAMVNMTNSCAYLFYHCQLEDFDFIKNLDTSMVTSTLRMFSNCMSVTSIPLFDTSNVTTMTGMFEVCSNLLDIPQFNTSNVTDMQNMFTSCNKLTTIPLLDTHNVTTMYSMFSSCFYLRDIPLLDTRNVTSMRAMFNNCMYLNGIPQLDARNVTNMKDTFHSCGNLKFILMYGMKVNFDISDTTKLEASDLVTILSNCQVLTSSQTLTMGSTNLAKLDGVYVKPTGVELYEGITCNPCVICDSTDGGAMLATDYFNAKGWTLA